MFSVQGAAGRVNLVNDLYERLSSLSGSLQECVLPSNIVVAIVVSIPPFPTSYKIWVGLWDIRRKPRDPIMRIITGLFGSLSPKP